MNRAPKFLQAAKIDPAETHPGEAIRRAPAFWGGPRGALALLRHFRIDAAHRPSPALSSWPHAATGKEHWEPVLFAMEGLNHPPGTMM
jgi:hypothetical protein